MPQPSTAPLQAQPQGPQVVAFPVTLGDDTPSPLQFADNPVQTDWASPSSTDAGDPGAPMDNYFNTVDNKANPGPWNIDGSQQDAGVAYNHNNDNTVMNGGTGYLGWITEWQNNMGGLFGDTPQTEESFLAPLQWEDARYMGRPITQDEGSDQYIVWSEPLDTTTTPNPLLAKFVPWLGG